MDTLIVWGRSPIIILLTRIRYLSFCLQGYEDIAALLLRAGAPVNCPVTEDASTPLHKACAGSKAGHLAAVKLLLGGGADVHALNKWRETPLLTAANHGQAGAVEALLASDADPCKCTDTGWSPLSIAAYKGHDECVRLLLEDGAPTEEDDPTLSALLQAATKGLSDTVELLLSHGADHTVTTKKGDTALSILVEQNLIDTAVEMVTEYNASIARCSRDRKKVQRARLLINLRMKQMEREGKEAEGATDDEETDDESSSPNVAQHVVNGASGSASSTPDSGKKKKKGKGKSNSKSAEEKAKAAEEALLRELEKEDQQAKEEGAKAATKQAKKKKQKERQRQLKQKEEQERREKEELEAKERERIRKEKEEKQRKEREEQLKVERERERREMMEREKLLAAKRKEREEREKREEEKKSQQRESGSLSPTGSRSSAASEKRVKQQKPKRAVTDPTSNRKIVSPKGSKKPAVPLVGNRRWETAAKQGKTSPSSTVEPVSHSEKIPTLPRASRKSNESAVPSTFLSPRLSQPAGGAASLGDSVAGKASVPVAQPPQQQTTRTISGTTASVPQYAADAVEHPAIALFRRDKVAELLKMCQQSLNLVDEQTVKRVLYRWIVRASHGKTPYSDPIIPSWLDSDQLVAYFQRQFIAESRRRAGASMGGPSMESLKEAGSSVAMFSQTLAKQVLEFRQTIDDQLPQDWTDAALGMTAAEGSMSGGSPMVILSWANRAQTMVSSSNFATLRERHVGPPTRFLAALFVTKIWYETTQMIVADTNMDFRLSPDTQACLSAEAGVTAELWSDPFSALNSHIFWGRFEMVDAFFGGQKPFGKDEQGSEEVLARHGGSLSVFLPLDTMVASQYVQRMVDILDTATPAGVPVSFAVVLSSDCFHDLPNGPSASDLRSLDPRLGDEQSRYVTRVEILEAERHAFYGGEGAGAAKVCASSSLFVILQNDPGKHRYNINDTSVARILASVSLNGPHQQSPPTSSASIGSANEYQVDSSLVPNAGYFEGLDPISPGPQRDVHAGFGSIGGNPLSNPLSPVGDGRGSRRGRLFELVDDGGDEDPQQSDDIMSGMLNNLDLGLFSSADVSSDNVDIEAISLMGIGGIGGAPTQSLRNPGNPRQGRLG